MSRKAKKPVESVRGTYSAMPHAVMDSLAYTGSSATAKALLNELIRQHNGGNNGRLHCAHSWLAPRGWASKSTVERARAELLKRGLIVQTKQGGLFIGPTWHALTWLAISNFVGLDIASNQYHPGAWMLCDLPKTGKRKAPVKKDCHPFHEGSADPSMRSAGESADPSMRAINPICRDVATPSMRDDVLIPLPTAGNLSAVQIFKARIDGRLTVPERAPNPLGRTRNVRLFKAAFGSLIHNATAPKVPTVGTHPAQPNNGAGVVSELHKKEAAAPGKPRKRIVGKAGKSGKPKNSQAATRC